MAAGGVDRQQT